MNSIRNMLIVVLSLFVYSAALADVDPRMTLHVLGKEDAPVKVDEYISLTCTHCADFYTTVLPELQAAYIDTGKVKFILHDFPLDGIALKAAAIARCMPVDEYYPFVSILYKNQAAWAFSGGNPENNMIQYAKLGGLPEDKARACANDSKLQDEIIAERESAGKLKIEATPTFILNDGAETIKGAENAQAFAAAFDRLLAAPKK